MYVFLGWYITFLTFSKDSVTHKSGPVVSLKDLLELLDLVILVLINDYQYLLLFHFNQEDELRLRTVCWEQPLERLG